MISSNGLIPPGIFPNQSSIPNGLNPDSNQVDKKELYTMVIEADPSIPPNQTLYIKNINDRIKIDVLKRDLMELFGKYGKILQIVAMKSFWRRGQAWIVFDNVESSTQAMNELQGFKIYGHTLQINYALEKSDIVSIPEGTFVQRPKGPKKPKKILQREMMLKQLYNSNPSNPLLTQNPVNPAHNLMGNPESFGFSDAPVNNLNMGTMELQGQVVNNLNLPYQPHNLTHPFPTHHSPGFSDDPSLMKRNRTLFVENLPDNISHNDVNNLFHNMPGFVETKLIASKHVAFIDFDNEFNSNYSLQGNFNIILTLFSTSRQITQRAADQDNIRKVIQPLEYNNLLTCKFY
ncbi:U1 snRNP protein, putative [Theileria annulata]|uniref:U1 snRNP protein, putative n=1 Tax=Theileria annulata TaxID=5874 RepID=Q4UD23_THEAN|nr:U1 snRNP protein, putative [Theileria annulata]CAI75278.1 U1 snRNP protein, putative [Theileria annulata]|eukprot:XP_954754.1 U1 snRNP protein, putative [Theileria annulata]